MLLPQSKEQIFLLSDSIGLREKTYYPLTLPLPKPSDTLLGHVC